MVTGAYYPEISGGGLQCRELVRALQDRVKFTVLTTTADSSLPVEGEVDGTPVYRVMVDMKKFGSELGAALRLGAAFVRLRRRFDIVHLHGFSRKSLLLVLLARLFRKKLGLKLTLVGEDDPFSIRKRGHLAFWCYSRADFFFGVCPRLQQLYRSSGLSQKKFWLVPNGVDVERFRPVDREERVALRRELGLPEESPLILFVGIFSYRKCPHVLFEAWRHLREARLSTGLVFVGAARFGSHEVAPDLARKIRDEVRALGAERHVVFVEKASAIEKYYRAADVFVLPSTREGLPNALLEAMAAGLPCVASRLEGVTDVLIDHGVNGLLFPPGDVAALEDALRFLMENPPRAWELGRRARETVGNRYSIARTADRCLEAYQRVNG